MTTETKGILETLRTNIRRLRNGVGWNQAELARRSGLTPDKISLIESGKQMPAILTVDKIATALGTDTGNLFNPDPNAAIIDLFQILDNAKATAARVKLSLQNHRAKG